MNGRLFISLFTDEDVADELSKALRSRGFEAMSATEAGRREADDEDQLAYAAENGYAILTYNQAHFSQIAAEWARTGREHAGIILSQQFSTRQFGELLRRVLRLLNTFTADDIYNHVVHLSQFRER